MTEKAIVVNSVTGVSEEVNLTDEELYELHLHRERSNQQAALEAARSMQRRIDIQTVLSASKSGTYKSALAAIVRLMGWDQELT